MIEVQCLNKTINGYKILHNIDFTVNSSEIIGYLGPNGAGKTTTINILATLLKPTSGSVFLNGYNVIHDAKKIRRFIGCVFDDFGLYPSLTVSKNLHFIGKLYNLSQQQRDKAIKQSIEFFDLREYLHTPVYKLSKGTKQKVNIAKSLLHDPDILFLDEPTSGLDPFTSKNILNLITSLKKEGRTIIITTHLLHLAEMVSDKIILLNKGKIIFNGQISSIKNDLHKNSLEDLYFSLLGDVHGQYFN